LIQKLDSITSDSTDITDIKSILDEIEEIPKNKEGDYCGMNRIIYYVFALRILTEKNLDNLYKLLDKQIQFNRKRIFLWFDEYTKRLYEQYGQNYKEYYREYFSNRYNEITIEFEKLRCCFVQLKRELNIHNRDRLIFNIHNSLQNLLSFSREENPANGKEIYFFEPFFIEIIIEEIKIRQYI
jgi:hypothetical protein